MCKTCHKFRGRDGGRLRSRWRGSIDLRIYFWRIGEQHLLAPAMIFRDRILEIFIFQFRGTASRASGFAVFVICARVVFRVALCFCKTLFRRRGMMNPYRSFLIMNPPVNDRISFPCIDPSAFLPSCFELYSFDKVRVSRLLWEMER